VRELQHVIERAVILSPEPPLRLDLSLPNVEAEPPLAPVVVAPPAPAAAGTPLKDSELRAMERQNVIAALEKARWRVAGQGGAAELLGIRPSTLRDRMKALGIQRPE
jgi:transcriptional regulator with GAF, ATPase, and Fis domain